MHYPPHVFADNPLDRGDQQRRNEVWLEKSAKDPESRFLAMPELDVPVDDGHEPTLSWLGARDLKWFGVDGEPAFLGLKDGVAHFAVYVPASSGAAARLRSDDSIRFADARSAVSFLSGRETGIVAQARAQLDWHNRHGFCSVCGHRTEMGRGGHVRKCPSCNAEHFPRTDPVAIMLVHNGEHCLLGQSRGRLSQMRMYSALAGVHGPGGVDRGGGRQGGQGGGRDRGEERPVPLITAVAISVVTYDRMPRGGGKHGHPQGR